MKLLKLDGGICKVVHYSVLNNSKVNTTKPVAVKEKKNTVRKAPMTAQEKREKAEKTRIEKKQKNRVKRLREMAKLKFYM